MSAQRFYASTMPSVPCKNMTVITATGDGGHPQTIQVQFAKRPLVGLLWNYCECTDRTIPVGERIMFCPSCGLEDQSVNQFCRNCGTPLHTVRSALEQPDAITGSAVTAREEIGRAISVKIAELESTQDLRRAVYEILPVVERFLESPEERRSHHQEQRLNQIREGVLTSLVGLAVILTFLLISWIAHEEKILIVSALGLLVLMIGLGITITASWFTASPKQSATSPRRPIKQLEPDGKTNGHPDKELPSARHSNFGSVTEGTTREL